MDVAKASTTSDESDPPPPYPGTSTGFSTQLDPGNGNVTETILAAQMATGAIAQNGRQSVSVVCPNCRSVGMTEVTVIQNTVETQAKYGAFERFFVIILVIVVVFFIIVAIIANSFSPLFAIPLFWFIGLIVYFFMRKIFLGLAPLANDIQHHCSVCRTLLGVNYGVKTFQDMQPSSGLF